MAKRKLERDMAICRAYTEERLTLREVANRFGLSRQRVGQIIQEQKIPANPRVKEGRDEFLGVFLSDDEKKKIVDKAEKEGVSISSIVRQMIHNSLDQDSITPP